MKPEEDPELRVIVMLKWKILVPQKKRNGSRKIQKNFVLYLEKEDISESI